jgi:8-oxo-dGTP pyrophosphatase MutT (NUDIX family)
MLEATLCFLVEGDPSERILLGFKKVGFGKGKYGGVGGKIMDGETAVHAAIRELEEETSIRVREDDLVRMAHLTFLFPHKAEWSQVVHVFLARSWTGEAVVSREIMPSWFRVDEIPFERMWADCRHWLPPVLAGQRTRARFVFGADNEAIDEKKVGRWDGHA